jgi:hypothetical protein
MTAEGRMAAEIDSATSSSILGKSPDHLADELAERHHISVPVLKKDGIAVEQVDAKVDVSHEPRRAIFNKDGKGTCEIVEIAKLGLDGNRLTALSYDRPPVQAGMH